MFRYLFLLCFATRSVYAFDESINEKYQPFILLAHTLRQTDQESFSDDTDCGTAALAIAITIGATEVHRKGLVYEDLFSEMGGRGKTMKGFAQFNTKFFGDNVLGDKEKYIKFLGKILTGQLPLPNRFPPQILLKSPANQRAPQAISPAQELVKAVKRGEVRDVATYIRFLQRIGLSGSNWQGLDDGWVRVPDLTEAIVERLLKKIGGNL